MPDEIAFTTGAARVRFAADGTVAGFAALARPELSFLSTAGEPHAWASGRAVRWTEQQVAVDVDELEVVRDSDAGVRATVRHTFDPAWTVRLLLVNATSEPVGLTEVALSWVPAPGCCATALAADAFAAYAAQPASGRGPVLVGRLVSGRQTRIGPYGLHLGAVALGSGERRVAQWRWELRATARQALGPDPLPRTTYLEASQTVVLPANPDVAVVAPGLDVETREDVVELGAPTPGRYGVRLHSARGTTALDLDWAPALDDLVETAAGRASAGPYGPSGAARLAGAAVGIVVQEALGQQRVADPDRAEDALDLLAGDLVESGHLDPLALAFLAREAERTGDGSLLSRAGDELGAAPYARAGLGLAATRVYLSLVRADRPVGPATARLRTLAETAVDATGSVDAAAAGLELLLLTRPRTPATLSPAVTDLLLRLGARLGAGLPGRPLDPLPVDTLAHLAAVLALVPEELGHELRAWWGISAAELGRRTSAQARCRLADEADGPDPATSQRALAWLVLAAPLA